MRLSPEAFYLSTNNGSNWITRILDDARHFPLLLLIGIFFLPGAAMGFYISTIMEQHWTTAGLADNVVTSIAASGANLIASTSSNVFLSTQPTEQPGLQQIPGLPNNGIVQTVL